MSKKTDGPYQSKGARGTADRIDTSPRDYYYYLAGQARHFGIATVVVRILGDGLEDQKWGVCGGRGGPEVLFDLCPGLRLFSGEGGANTRHHGAVFIRCTVEIQPRLVSLALGLSSPNQRGSTEPNNPNQIYLYIYIQRLAYIDHGNVPFCLYDSATASAILDPAGSESGSSSGCPSVVQKTLPCQFSDRVPQMAGRLHMPEI